jgi:hypothetical protein
VNKRYLSLAGIIGAMLAVLFLLYWLTGCASLRRTSMVGGGAGGGAAIGALAGGPVGAIGGAVVGGAVASAVVDSDHEAERADRLENKLGGIPTPPPPPWWAQIPWWTWLAALWVWLRRAHLADALTGKEPRWDAVLRALGVRTHKTPIGGGKP